MMKIFPGNPSPLLSRLVSRICNGYIRGSLIPFYVFLHGCGGCASLRRLEVVARSVNLSVAPISSAI